MSMPDDARFCFLGQAAVWDLGFLEGLFFARGLWRKFGDRGSEVVEDGVRSHAIVRFWYFHGHGHCLR